MPWYIWLLIGVCVGANAGLLLACLLHSCKEADQRHTLLMRVEKMEGQKFGGSGATRKFGREGVGV